MPPESESGLILPSSQSIAQPKVSRVEIGGVTVEVADMPVGVRISSPDARGLSHALTGILNTQHAIVRELLQLRDRFAAVSESSVEHPGCGGPSGPHADGDAGHSSASRSSTSDVDEENPGSVDSP